jgi:hypothetical protein
MPIGRLNAAEDATPSATSPENNTDDAKKPKKTAGRETVNAFVRIPELLWTVDRQTSRPTLQHEQGKVDPSER